MSSSWLYVLLRAVEPCKYVHCIFNFSRLLSLRYGTKTEAKAEAEAEAGRLLPLVYVYWLGAFAEVVLRAFPSPPKSNHCYTGYDKNAPT